MSQVHECRESVMAGWFMLTVELQGSRVQLTHTTPCAAS